MSEVTERAGRLGAAAEALGLELADAQFEQLLSYLELIAKWNKVYNLTAVRDPEEMLVQHLFDSLAAVGPLRRQTGGRPIRLLDVGSGAGLPGVVIAICCPDVQVECVDTVGKKAAFVQQAAAQLQLANLRGLHDRVEKLKGPYDIVCSRASMPSTYCGSTQPPCTSSSPAWRMASCLSRACADS